LNSLNVATNADAYHGLDDFFIKTAMKYLIGLVTLFLVACAGTGEIQQGNENAVSVLDRAGNYGDAGASIAAAYCARFGKVAVFEGETGPWVARRVSYLCK
jgi:hypothetical protein